MFQSSMMIFCNRLRNLGRPGPAALPLLAPTSLSIDPFALGHVPPAARRMTLAHFRQKLFVSLMLLPFFQEWVNDHGEIETDQKSPHGVSFWRT